jgi:hypothetical protein
MGSDKKESLHRPKESENKMTSEAMCSSKEFYHGIHKIRMGMGLFDLWKFIISSQMDFSIIEFLSEEIQRL